MMRRLFAAALLSSLIAPLGMAGDAPARPEQLAPYINRPITDDVIYFVLPDRFQNGDTANDGGGIEGGPLDHGFDPTRKGFFHGGDIKGLTAKLDYLANMGVSTVWLTPIFKNKPVQGMPNHPSAGYHGYWVTDFTQIDPHLGTNDDLKALVTEAHRRNMKVVFDIITNHTADVIKYRECHPLDDRGQPVTGTECRYRSKADYPYSVQAGPSGKPINQGFRGDDPAHQTAENFSHLTDMTYAYTPYVPQGEESVKVPAWLNDIRYYHNRGDSTFEGESSLYGDFAGLDDVFTEHPDVVAGFTDIYKFWISEFRIDGFRIDTVRHVNDSFWQAFAPAIKAHAAEVGIPNFYIFGEVYDPNPEHLSHYIREARLPAVLDFGFQHAALRVVAEGEGTAVLADFFAADRHYGADGRVAGILPTFLGNHDMGRFGHFILRAHPEIDDAKALKLSELGHALMYFSRGVPVVYYGDEQGFTGDGNDQDAREDMFESQVASYNDNRLIGTTATTASDNFDPSHPLYRALQGFAAIRQAHPALRGGGQAVLQSGRSAGLFALERTAMEAGERLVVLFNTSAEAKKGRVDLHATPTGLCLVAGAGGEAELKGNHLTYKAPALSWAIYDTRNCDE